MTPCSLRTRELWTVQGSEIAQLDHENKGIKYCPIYLGGIQVLYSVDSGAEIGLI